MAVRDDAARTSDALMRASRVITAAVAHSLAAVDEPPSVPGLRVLVMLQNAGELNLSAVAHGLGVNPSSASRTCDRLVAADLVDRQNSTGDRRQISLRLTPRGTAFLRNVMHARQAVLDQVIAQMPPRARTSLAAGLEAFVAAAEKLAEDDGLSDGTGKLLRWVT